jgi:hypothetical protein
LHTVIITDPQTTKEFVKYKHLYAPFLANRGGSISHCIWKNKSSTRIEDAVPGLYDAIEGHPEWRAIIVVKSPSQEIINDPNNPESLNDNNNPFDFTCNSPSELSRFDMATKPNKSPLVCLTHMLAGLPSLGVIGYETTFVYRNEKTGKRENCLRDGKPLYMSDIEKEIDIATKNYKKECKSKMINPLQNEITQIRYEIITKYNELLKKYKAYKQEMFWIPFSEDYRKKYKALSEKYVFDENRPVEVLILSTREQSTYDEHEETRESIERAWQFFDEIESTDFWKVYPNTCRFLCFDLINEDHTLYRCEYWKFFLLALTLAYNDQLPGHALQAYHLYKADLQINEEKLGQVYNVHIENLMSFQEVIQERMAHVPELTIDKNKDLVPEQYISVEFGHIDESKVKTKNDIFGLSTNCPKNEAEYWYEHRQNIGPIVDDILFAPQEIVAEKALETRLNVDNFANTEQVLDRFQIKRIEKRIEELEPHIVNTKLFKLLDADMYKKEIEKSAEDVQKHIKIRMTKQTIILISVCSLFVYACGYIPYLINSAKESWTIFGTAIGLVLITLIVLAGIGFITIWLFKRKLIKIINKYNKDVTDVFDRAKKSSRVFSNYFSKVCTYMFARSLVTGIVLKKDNDHNTTQKLKEHLEHLNSEIDKILNICSLYNVHIDTAIVHRSFENITDALLEETPKESKFYELTKYEDKGTMKLTAAPTIKLARKLLTSKKNDQWEHYDTGINLDAPYSFISGINLVREEIYRKEGS